MQTKNIRYILILFLCALIAPAGLAAKVTSEEAAMLKTTLTPYGAERAGNEDGTIPPWGGGLTGPPDGVTHVPGERPVNPYAGEKQLYSITAANMAQYADRLSEGQKSLLQTYPDTYRLDIYPTYRSHAAPEWVYDNIFENATRAETSDDGASISGAFGGVPFPIPQNGAQVMWNHLVRYQGSGLHYKFQSLYVDGNRIIPASGVENWEKFPYYDENKSIEDYTREDFYYVLLEYFAPIRRSGEMLVLRDPLNQAVSPRQAWQYLVGQRRVRRAPSIAYDTPLASLSGIMTWDEVYLFNGALDRYDWHLVGKQELYIPYNNYEIAGAMDVNEVFHPGHVNPDIMRWERHRVWKVEATLKEGNRHIYDRRVFYFDEDSWVLMMSDNYDAQGNLWRTNMTPLINAYQLPSTVQLFSFHYDFRINKYGVNACQVGMTPYKNYPEPQPDSFFTPEELRRRGLR